MTSRATCNGILGKAGSYLESHSEYSDGSVLDITIDCKGCSVCHADCENCGGKQPSTTVRFPYCTTYKERKP